VAYYRNVNLRVLVLVLGTFAIGTGTFVVTGILGSVSEDLSVSVGTAGYLVTVFAVAYAVGSPLLVAVTGKVARRRLLVGALILFAVANAVAAVVPTFSLLLATRVLGALGAAVLTPVAGAVAAELAEPEHKGRALSLVLGGLSVSWVVGIPLGAMIGDRYGWRMSFVLVAVLSVLAALAVWALLPAVENTSLATGLASSLAVAKRPAVLVAAGVTGLGVAAGFVVLTYVRPLLESLTSFGGSGIGWMLLLFGLASVTGTALGGFAADRFGYRRSAPSILVVLTASLLSFSLIPASQAGSLLAVLGAGTALVTWSVVGFALIPLQQYRLIGVAPEDQNEVLSLNASAIYLGQGFGSGLGSLVLGYASLSSLGWVGALCAAAALIVLTLGGCSREKRSA
jgi:predicted MFS family arabinose efflux permease